MAEAVCFTCGMGADDPPRLNRLENGQICPACRDRVLESLPPILPDLKGVRGIASVEPAETPDESDDPPAA